MHTDIDIICQRWRQSLGGEAADPEFCSSIEWKASYDVVRAYKQIYQMALLYMKNKSNILKEKIINCMEWMYENRYGKNELTNTGWRDINAYDWHDWQVSAPREIINILMLVGEFFDENQIKKYLALFDMLVSEPRDYGCNKIDFGMLIIGSGLLQRDKEKIKKAIEKLDDLFWFADEHDMDGQGFYTDGSYIFHTRHSMNGMYGLDHFRRAVELARLLAGTEFALSTGRYETINNWMINAFMPLVYKGYMYRMVCGRSDNANGFWQGGEVLKACLQMLDFADEKACKIIKDFIKSYDFEAYDHMPKLIDSEKEVLADILAETTSPEPIEFSKMYYNMDKFVHRREHYSFAVSMSSSRIYNYECINNANKCGWYLGDGMCNLVTDDINHYNRTYWSNVDFYNLPGITADTQKRAEVSIGQSNEYLSSKDFVGAAVLDNKYSAVAMELESYHSDGNYSPDNKFPDAPLDYGGPPPVHDCSLTAKKAWFCFDDEIVCMGSGITSSDPYDAHTIVENRRTDKVTYGDGWCWFENAGGYSFHEKKNPLCKSENGFEILYFNHGKRPQSETYAYTVLPNATKERTEQYDSNPDVQILCNNENVSAVHHNILNTDMYVFWNPGSFENISVSDPVIIVRSPECMAVADPTQKLESVVINGKEHKLPSSGGATLKINNEDL